MKSLTTWNLGIDDEFREYLNFMLSIAVIFILTILALKVYQHYNVKAKLTETYIQLITYRAFVHEYYGVVHKLPSDEVLRTEFIDSESQFNSHMMRLEYSDISFADGAIILTFADDYSELEGTTFSFTPVVNDNTGTIRWLCGYARLADDSGSNRSNSTIPKKFLVNICRE